MLLNISTHHAIEILKLVAIYHTLAEFHVLMRNLYKSLPK